MNKKLIFVLIITVFAFSLSAYQYIKEFQSEFADAAYSGKPATGHSWSEMECSEGLCITAGNDVGIGTSTPGYKLDVAGNIGTTGGLSVGGNISTSGAIAATGDVCGAGACLSQIASFVANQPLVNNIHNQGACTAAGGTVTPSDVSYPICKFNASSCPSGWAVYKSYMKRENRYVANCYQLYGNDWGNVASQCGVNYMNFVVGDFSGCPTASCGCSCPDTYPGSATCSGSVCVSYSALITQIGCY